MATPLTPEIGFLGEPVPVGNGRPVGRVLEAAKLLTALFSNVAIVCLGRAPEMDVFLETGREPLFTGREPLFTGKVVEFPLGKYVGLAAPLTCRLLRVVGLGVDPDGESVFLGRNPVVGILVVFLDVGKPWDGLAPTLICLLFRMVGLGMDPVGEKVFFGMEVMFFAVGKTADGFAVLRIFWRFSRMIDEVLDWRVSLHDDVEFKLPVEAGIAATREVRAMAPEARMEVNFMVSSC